MKSLADSGGFVGGENRAPWLAEVQQPPASLPRDAPRLPPLLTDEQGRAIATVEAWKRKRETIRRDWLEFLKPWKREGQSPPRYTVTTEDRPAGVVRQLIRYDVEPGISTTAYLLLPAERKASIPGVVVLHPTVNNSILEPAGVEGRETTAFGLHLAQHGYAAICPRNFLWSDDRTLSIKTELPKFQARHPGATGMAKMLYDATVALDLLASLPGVDPKRLGAIGHSLGAKETLYLAAFDERVKVSVSSEGGIGTAFSNWHDPWYLGEEVKRRSRTHEHHELLALAAPRAFLLLGGDSADGAKSWPFIEAALPVYRLYGGSPRVGLLNHREGHSVPQKVLPRIEEWFAAYS